MNPTTVSPVPVSESVHVLAAREQSPVDGRSSALVTQAAPAPDCLSLALHNLIPKLGCVYAALSPVVIELGSTPANHDCSELIQSVPFQRRVPSHVMFPFASNVNTFAAPAVSTSYWRVVVLPVRSAAVIVKAVVPAPTCNDPRDR